MPSGSIVTAKEYLRKSLERRGKRIEDGYLDRPVVLALPVFLRRLEATELVTRIEHVHYEEVYERDGVLYLPSLVSSPRSAIRAEELAVFRATALVHVGFAGSLDPALGIGGLVVSDGAINETGAGLLYGHELDSLIPADEALAGRLHAWLEGAGRSAVRARNWSTDAPMKETWEKVERYRGLGAACVEMETGGLLAVARAAGIPASAIYLISDVLTEGGWEQGWHDPAFKDGIQGLGDLLATIQEAIAP
jgi:uridine phosphorylase